MPRAAWALLVALLLSSAFACERRAPPAPESPAAALLRSRCVTCHTTDYVTQQRLTPAQWDKTVAKMETWGAVLTGDEKSQLTAWLAATWRADVPERAAPMVPAPVGAVASSP